MNGSTENKTPRAGGCDGAEAYNPNCTISEIGTHAQKVHGHWFSPRRMSRQMRYYAVYVGDTNIGLHEGRLRWFHEEEIDERTVRVLYKADESEHAAVGLMFALCEKWNRENMGAYA